MALIDRPALLAGAGAAAAGWGIVTVPVLLLWVATPYADGDLTAVPRLAGSLWLLGHGGPLRWDGPAGHAALGVAPLLVTALVAGLVQHAAARTGRRAEVVLGYLGVAAPVALLGLGGRPRTEPLPDLVWVTLLTLLAAAAGARRSTGEWGVAAAWRAVRARGEWLGVWPVPAPDGGLARRLEWARSFAPQRDEALRAGLAGALALLGGGAAVLAVAMLVHLGAAGTLASLLAPDLIGRVSLLLLCVVLLPNAVVWSVGYALGTGFTLGGHASALGSQPLAPIAVPLLADAPAAGRPLLGLAALAAPLAAGAVVGWALSCGTPASRALAAADPAGPHEPEDPDDAVGPDGVRAADGVPGPVGAVLGGREAAGPGQGVGPGEGAEDGDATREAEDGRPGPERSMTALAVSVLGAAACTGLLMGAAALWSGGALGDEALAQVGPPVVRTALAAFCWTLAVALPTAFVLRRHRSRTGPVLVEVTPEWSAGTPLTGEDPSAPGPWDPTPATR